jgi:DNA-binding PadR family transcriptional regulator
MLQGYLKLIVLKELIESKKTGYELIGRLKKITGKKPSAGSVYPLLNDLFKNKFVSKKNEGAKKVYTITAKGKSLITSIIKEKKEMMVKHMGIVKLLGNVAKEKELQPLKKLISDVHQKGELVLFNIGLLTELRNTLYQLISSEDYSLKEKKIQGVLKKTVLDLKKLMAGAN